MVYMSNVSPFGVAAVAEVTQPNLFGEAEPTGIDGGKAIHQEVQDATPTAISELSM